MMDHVRKLYGEDVNIWLTGAGFGGGAASIATSYYYLSSHRKPAVVADGTVHAITFNAPGDFWYLKRRGMSAE